MKYEKDNIEVGQRLKASTVRKADVALHKKRFRILTASSLAAVACALIVVIFFLGGEPLPDVVLNNPDAGLNPQATESIDMLNFDYMSLAKVYPLSFNAGEDGNEKGLKTLPSSTYKLESQNISEELASYGFSADISSGDIPDGYICYLASFETPATGLRYVALPLQSSGSEILFQCTCLDLGPFTAEDYYPGPGPTLPAESSVVFLVALPPIAADYDFTAEYMKWSDLSERMKVATVIDTIIKHEDLNEAAAKGVSSSLAFELKVLSDYLDTAVEYLREYSCSLSKNSESDANESYVIRCMFYELLNSYQLRSMDMGDPVKAVEKELYSAALNETEDPSKSLVIPITHIIDIKQEEKSAEAVLYTGIYTFTPPKAPTYEYRAVRAYLDKTEDGTWEVSLMYSAQTPAEVFNHMEEYAEEIINIDSTFVKSNMIMSAIEMRNTLTGENMANDMQQEFLTIDLNAIEQYRTMRYDEINDPYSAVSRDMCSYVLDKESNDDVLQIAAVYPLSEDFDNPITVAVLAATYDGKSSEPQKPKLYVVKAEYDKSRWTLTDIESEEEETLSLDEFPKLQYRGFYEVYETLFSELTREVEEVNRDFNITLPLPQKDESALSGGYLDLGIESGVSRFVNVSRFIRPVEDYGCMIPLWYAEENPADLSYSAFARAVNNADWQEINESEMGRPYSKTELGFLGYSINIDLQNENGLYKFNFTFDTLRERALLTVTSREDRDRFFLAEDAALCAAGIETFNIDTDVSEYMVDDEKGPKLPDYREELKYLVPIVGDMPGGIASISATVGSELAASGIEDTVIDRESKIIDWAQAVGEAIDAQGLKEIRQTPAIGMPPVVWDVELEAQEGVGKLQMAGYTDTGTVYIRKTYRLYGSTEAHEQFFVSQSSELFDLLCELSFGKTLMD